MEILEAPAPPKHRTVALHTWWKNAKGTRTFALIHKYGRGVGYDYRTTEVELLEVGHTSLITYPIGQFFDLIDRGSLIEMQPETVNLQPTASHDH